MNESPVALVTGGGRGIGRAIAVGLAAIGYDIVVNYHSDADSAEEVRQHVEATGRQCATVQADVSSRDDRGRLIECVRATFGRLDVLVNNAGVAPLKRTDLLEADEDSFDRVMETNLKGPYFLTQRAAVWMIEQRKSHPERKLRIINIGSVSAYASSPSRGEYCISKAGIGMMTRLYADRLAEFGIGVYEIRPGIIRTDMTRAVQEKYDAMIAEGLTPIRRWGTPEDAAQAVCAVAEGRLDYSTGQVIDVDGGFHLRRL